MIQEEQILNPVDANAKECVGASLNPCSDIYVTVVALNCLTESFLSTYEHTTPL